MMITTDALIETVRDLSKDYERDIITKEAYYAERGALEVEWRQWLAVENGIGHLSSAVQDKVFGLAYEHGHASGYSDIANYYVGFAELAAFVAA